MNRRAHDLSEVSVVASTATADGGHMADNQQSNGSMSRARQAELWQFRLIFMMAFFIFLVVAIIARLLPRQWRPGSAGELSHKSIIDEAKAAASTVVPFAFMG